jgi:hypothetical protein
MNDLSLIHELGAQTPLPSLAELSSARATVVEGIAAAEGGRHAFRAPAEERRGAKRHGPRRPGRRIVFGSVAVAAAAAIAGGVLAGMGAPRHGGTGTALRGGSSSGVVPARLTAREVLDRAAKAALRGADVAPQGDQFVYTEVGGGPGAPVVRTWLSVDGTRNGLWTATGSDGKVQSIALLGCANGVREIRTPGVGGKPPVPCTAEPAFFPDMPTSAGAMGAYLSQTQGIRSGDLNDLAKTVGSMLESDYILPAQRAALYEFLATTPGLIVEPDVRDISGRPGVGVGWSFEGGKAMNIFDPSTYAYLGLTTWGIQGQLGGDALLATAITDNAGQVP